MILTARVIPEAGGTYGVQLNHDGPIVMTQESYQVCSNVAHALTHPEQWEPSEAYEVADVIRAARAKGGR